MNTMSLFAALALFLLPVLAFSQAPRNPIAGKAMASRVEAMLAATNTTKYQHKTEIDEAAGNIRCDCSGLIGYVLRSDFPEAYLALKAEPAPWRSRPLAVTYYETAKAAPVDGTSPWLPVRKLMDARPGDVMAWRKTTLKKGSTTGHVMMLASKPVLEQDGRVRIRVIDSTTGLHANDTRTKGNGFGAGEMWFEPNKAGEPVGLWVNAVKPKSKINLISIGRLRDLGMTSAADLDEDRAFLGLTKTQAIALADQRKRDWRVIAEGGKVQPLKTMRIIESRLNFVIADGKVVRVRRG